MMRQIRTHKIIRIFLKSLWQNHTLHNLLIIFYDSPTLGKQNILIPFKIKLWMICYRKRKIEFLQVIIFNLSIRLKIFYQN